MSSLIAPQHAPYLHRSHPRAIAPLRSGFLARGEPTAAIHSCSCYGSFSAFSRVAVSRKFVRRGVIEVRAAAGFPLSSPLVAPSSHWGMWTVLLCIAAFGIWSEKATHWGSVLSGALVSTLVGLAASNIGLISTEAPTYSIVNHLRCTLKIHGHTGSEVVVATIVGTLVAMKVVPLRTLGSDGWKIAAALMSRHIGGAVNYVAVSEAFGVSSSALAAGLAADNLLCAVYFTTVFALASRVPKESIPDIQEDAEKIALKPNPYLQKRVDEHPSASYLICAGHYVECPSIAQPSNDLVGHCTPE
ncbi:hypothetical protein L7F22_027993 [Adiantum nelumboides]|nr:hypothetical protein [Adiantum nelumboides]